MRLVDGVESALHLCVLLAVHPSGALPAAQLAEFHALAPAATAKVLQQLAAAGVLETRTGRTGGYVLARPAADISVAEIVAATGSPGPVFRCREIRRQGPCATAAVRYSPRCAIAGVMDEAETAWWGVLGAQSLAALAARIDGQLDPAVRSAAGKWLRERVRTP